MTKRLATVAAIIVAAASAPRLTGQVPAQDLWIGVLQGTVLIPAAALVDGKWWSERHQDPDQDSLLLGSVGQMPARWQPAPRRLPQRWRAHLFSGRTAIVHSVGPLMQTGILDGNFGVRTTLRAPSPELDTFDELGIAVAGTVDVRLFITVAEDRRPPAVLRFIATLSSREARMAIKRYGTSAAEDAKTWAALTDEAISQGSFNVEGMFSTTQRDGSVIYFVEQNKDYPPDRSVRVAVTVVQDPAHNLRLASIHGEAFSDNFISLRPLAILDRGNHRCWLTALQYEDGVAYRLAKPGNNSYSGGALDCNLK